MFVFDKRLDPEQAINYKPSSKAPFGYLLNLTVSTGGITVPDIATSDPIGTADVAAGGSEAAAAVLAVGLLTRVRWDLGASDPILIEGLLTMASKQVLVGLLYSGLADIGVNFGINVYEYDPVATPKKYYLCFSAPALIGKLVKDGERELAIELSDDEELSIQDSSFYAFSMKIAPNKAAQPIILASKSIGGVTKLWGRTSSK